MEKRWENDGKAMEKRRKSDGKRWKSDGETTESDGITTEKRWKNDGRGAGQAPGQYPSPRHEPTEHPPEKRRELGFGGVNFGAKYIIFLTFYKVFLFFKTQNRASLRPATTGKRRVDFRRLVATRRVTRRVESHYPGDPPENRWKTMEIRWNNDGKAIENDGKAMETMEKRWKTMEKR